MPKDVSKTNLKKSKKLNKKQSRKLSKKKLTTNKDKTLRLNKGLKQTANLNNIIENIWPQERDVMFRPDRLRYVRQLKSKDRSCVFCAAIESGLFSVDSLVLYKTKFSVVMLNKYPYNVGHLLVLPLRHEGQLDIIEEKELIDLSLTVQKCVGVLKKEYKCPGLNIGLNHGEVAGAGIPSHLHWHIIPRWYGDTNFFPLIAETKVQVESLEQTYNRLKPYFINNEFTRR